MYPLEWLSVCQSLGRTLAHKIDKAGDHPVSILGAGGLFFDYDIPDSWITEPVWQAKLGGHDNLN